MWLPWLTAINRPHNRVSGFGLATGHRCQMPLPKKRRYSPRMTEPPLMQPERVSQHRRGVVAILMRENRLLVIRRSQTVVAPGAYCFPGGGIEGVESEKEALIREIQEELGMAVVPRRRAWSSVTPWGVELAWWQADFRAECKLCPNPAEVESVHWCTPAEMAALPGLLESNRQFLAGLETGNIRLERRAF